MTLQKRHAQRAAALAITLAKMRAGVPLAVLLQPKDETNLRASAPRAPKHA